MFEIPARRFFTLVERLPAYDGMLAARLEMEKEGRSPSKSDADTHANRSSSSPSSSTQSAGNQPEKKYFRDLHHNPELMQYFEGPGER